MRKNYLKITCVLIMLTLLPLLISCNDNSNDVVSEEIKSKNYDLTVVFPDGYDYTKVTYSVNDGKGYGSPSSYINKSTILNGKAYSAYTNLKVIFPDKSTYELWIKSGEEAIIEVISEGDFKLKNVLTDEEIGVTAYKDYLKPYETDLGNFFKANKAIIDEGGDSIRKVVSERIDNILQARLKYVQNNKYSYYAFHIFKRELLQSSIPGSVLDKTYSESFNEEIKQYWDAQQVASFLAGKKLAVGDKVPDLELKDIEGKKIVLSENNSKATLVQFWASWCPFCIAEMPNIQKIYQANSKKGLNVLSVTLDRDSIAFDKARQKYKMNWTHSFGYGNLAKEFGFTALPAFVLISEDGIILLKKDAFRLDDDFDELNQIIEKTLQ